MLLGEEKVIVQGMTAEENSWGKYQFPKLYNANGRLFVSVHVEDDIIVTTGNPTLWFESVDKGETWVEVSANEATEEEKHYILFTLNFRLKKRDFFGKT